MSTLYAINGEIINSQEPLPIPVDILTLLWENPNPSAAFATQSVTVDDSDVDFFVIFFRYVYNATSLGRTEIVPKMFPQIWNEFSQGQGAQSGGTLIYRGVRQTTAGSITFEDAKIGSAAGSWSTDNNYLIPYKIYGIKKQVPMQSGGGGTKYDPETDMIYLWDGTQWVEWKKAGLKSIWDALKVNKFEWYRYQSYLNPTVSLTSENLTMQMDSSNHVISTGWYAQTHNKALNIHVKGTCNNLTQPTSNRYFKFAYGPTMQSGLTGATVLQDVTVTNGNFEYDFVVPANNYFGINLAQEPGTRSIVFDELYAYE